MDRFSLAALLLLLALLVATASAQTVSSSGRHKPWHPKPQDCDSTTERPVRKIKLGRGQTFCLRLPRFLKNPELDVTGTKKFVRTYDDTCGLYGIVFSTFAPRGGGPPPHIHWADNEWFLPGTEGDVVRVHAQAASTGPYKPYLPGQVPGFNMPAIKVGGAEVPYGGIGYSPSNTPHAWKAATNLTNFMAIWEFGFAMKPGVNIPEAEPASDAALILQQTGLWGIPTDVSGAMFGGNAFVDTAREPIALPPPQWKDLQRLQDLFDRGEKCCQDC